MKYSLLFCLLGLTSYASAQTAISESCLYGTWKSDRKLSRQYNQKHSNASQSMQDFLHQNIGYTTVIYQPNHLKYTVAEHQYKGETFKEMTDEFDFKITQFNHNAITYQPTPDGRDSLPSGATLYFKTRDIYYVNVAENMREYLRRQSPTPKDCQLAK